MPAIGLCGGEISAPVTAAAQPVARVRDQPPYQGQCRPSAEQLPAGYALATWLTRDFALAMVARTALARSVRNLAEIAGSRSIRKPCASVLPREAPLAAVPQSG